MLLRRYTCERRPEVESLSVAKATSTRDFHHPYPSGDVVRDFHLVDVNVTSVDNFGDAVGDFHLLILLLLINLILISLPILLILLILLIPLIRFPVLPPHNTASLPAVRPAARKQS